MADVPEWLTLKRHRDLVGRDSHLWARRILLAVLGLLVALAAVNTFGQRPSTRTGDAPAAALTVHSPERLRSGLYYESRFTIEAHEEIENATLLLDTGWFEGMTLNTLEPVPVGEASRNGRVALELGHVPAGGRHRFFLHFQVNPTTVGRRAADVELLDGERLLVHLDRTVTIFP